MNRLPHPKDPERKNALVVEPCICKNPPDGWMGNVNHEDGCPHAVNNFDPHWDAPRDS